MHIFSQQEIVPNFWSARSTQIQGFWTDTSEESGNHVYPYIAFGDNRYLIPESVA
jgi:hypothetical protein